MKSIPRIIVGCLMLISGSTFFAADPEEIAREILDASTAEDRRAFLIREHLGHAPELIRAMTKDLGPGDEEYRRIPNIWRVAISAGRRDETSVLRRLLEISLPKENESLRDWQAVVLGGGIINGWSLEGKWPKERLDELVRDEPQLQQRWQSALAEAHRMADDKNVPTGTRYDALRMIALDTWDRGGKHILQYLGRSTHAELQMGAVSGLGDMDCPEAATALIQALKDLTNDNRRLAIDCLLRTTERKQMLREGIDKGIVSADWLSDAQRNALKP
ncbi:MAG: HEAT repeat domain-containing protein [Gemmataceae bacterium]|nr:HEAT repeat domain-containing protein [Gemmataceae bacterium]